METLSSHTEFQFSALHTYSLRSQKRERPDGKQKGLLFFAPNTHKSQKRKRPDDEQKSAASCDHYLECSSEKPKNASLCDDFLKHSSEESEEESECGSVDTERGYYSQEQQRKDMKEMMNSKDYINAMKSVKAEMEKCPEKFQEK